METLPGTVEPAQSNRQPPSPPEPPPASQGSSPSPASTPSSGATRSPLVLVVVTFVVALMLYFGYHRARRPGAVSASHLAQSTVAPDFSLESLDGQTMRLSDLRGKAVLLNFWATWCGPCKIEMPWFVDFQNQYGSQGLQIVGVAMDDASKEDIGKFAKDMGVNYPILIGTESAGNLYGGVPALPETFLISRDGKIVDKIIGLKSKADIADSIRRTLDTQPARSEAWLQKDRENGPVPK
jgi:peroxiredoxin